MARCVPVRLSYVSWYGTLNELVVGSYRVVLVICSPGLTMPVTFSVVYAQFSPRDAMQTVRRLTLGVAYSLWNNVCREQLIRDFFQCLIVIRQGNGRCLMTDFGYLTCAIILILLLCNVVLCNQPLNVFD